MSAHNYVHGTQRPESVQGLDAVDKYSPLPSSSSEESDHTPRLSLWDLRCMRAIQGATKLPLNSPTVAGNYRTTGDHNFEYGNYAVLFHETRDINDDGGDPILPISFINAAADFQQVLDDNEDRCSTVQPCVTDADRMDTAPKRGAVITEEVR